MSNDKKYNGWTNYETWLINLWMSEGSNYYDDLAQELFNNKEDSQDKEDLINDLSNRLKQEHEEYIETVKLPSSGWITDLINASLSEVDWYEIAEHYISEVWDEDKIAKVV